jgi:hypothetical protein
MQNCGAEDIFKPIIGNDSLHHDMDIYMITVLEY